MHQVSTNYTAKVLEVKVQIRKSELIYHKNIDKFKTFNTHIVYFRVGRSFSLLVELIAHLNESSSRALLAVIQRRPRRIASPSAMDVLV